MKRLQYSVGGCEAIDKRHCSWGKAETDSTINTGVGSKKELGLRSNSGNHPLIRPRSHRSISAPGTPFVRKSRHGQAFAEMSMNPDPSLFNKDLAPVPASKRTWGMYNYVSLWVAMSVCIPTYMLASSLIAGGMNWWQAIGTILLGNLIVRSEEH